MLSKRADGYPVVKIKTAGYMTKLHRRLEKQGRLPMWVIYRPTTQEYPGQWCARMRVGLPVSRPMRFVISHDSLAELHSILPPGLLCFPRDPSDPPEIEETWL